ncbi:MAG: type II toxin-antitoxin system VapC family toxin [Acidobacteriota bacterium]
MRLLLDTCTFLWLVGGTPDVSSRAREAFVDPDNDVYLSAASAWEIALKQQLGRLRLPEPAVSFVPAQRAAHGIEPLPIDEDACLHISKLPPLHRDPFDRLLVAQALAAGLVLVTPDDLIRQYPVRTLW